MVRYKKILMVIMISSMLLCFFSCSVNAGVEEDAAELECYEEYRQMLDALPDDLAEMLPDKLYSSKVSDIIEGASEITDFEYIMSAATDLMGLELDASLRMLATLVGILVLAGVLNTVKKYFSSTSINEVFSLTSCCAVFLVVILAQYEIISSVAAFFSRVCTLANSMLPLMGVLYAMGGNVGGAVTSHISLMTFMGIVENLCAQSVIPISGICISFAAISAIAPDMNIGGLSKSIKKTYTIILTFIMTVFGTVMSAQSVLASKADSLAGKTVKFAVGNMIPIVGSALSGTMGAVSTSIEYIRSGVGIVGIAAILLLLLPTLVTLLLNKTVLSLSGGMAELLGCEREGKIVHEMSSINGFLLACACICSVTLIFMTTLFVKCSSALGGGWL